MKTLITAFFIPPGVAVLLALITLYLWRRKPAASKVCLVLCIVLGWVLATEAFGRVMSTALIAQVSSRQNIDPTPNDVIVVLGAGMRYVGPHAGFQGWLPTAESYRRYAVAQNLQEKLGARIPIIISGGRTEGLKHPSEAQVIWSQFDREQAKIIPVELEESSTNTYENALYSVAKIQDRGAKNVFLATGEVHMLRALATFRGQGLDPIAIPVFSIKRGAFELEDFLPSWEGVEATSKALYEIYGLTEYILSDKIKLEDIFYTAN